MKTLNDFANRKYSKDYWQNNLFNKRINEEFPKKFSLCDLDGLVVYFNDKKTRLIIFEVKRKLENCSKSQLWSLNLLRENIKWENFDDKSGMFLIQGLDDNYDKSEIYEINRDGRTYLMTVDFEYYKNWFYDEKL